MLTFIYPWFVAKDVCDILEIKNTTQAMQKLDTDERTMFNIGRQGETNIINESGLYSIVLTSRKREAKALKRWVTREVIPSIRHFTDNIT
ncbi:BRO-N domain-containing protein [Bacillus tropicus]|uniref:BRO-N domain-containing protein n=1 Tax=Bacillus tropicus TaxID=2026188 RepID=UPI003D9E8D89